MFTSPNRTRIMLLVVAFVIAAFCGSSSAGGHVYFDKKGCWDCGDPDLWSAHETRNQHSTSGGQTHDGDGNPTVGVRTGCFEEATGLVQVEVAQDSISDEGTKPAKIFGSTWGFPVPYMQLLSNVRDIDGDGDYDDPIYRVVLRGDTYEEFGEATLDLYAMADPFPWPVMLCSMDIPEEDPPAVTQELDYLTDYEHEYGVSLSLILEGTTYYYTITSLQTGKIRQLKFEQHTAGELYVATEYIDPDGRRFTISYGETPDYDKPVDITYVPDSTPSGEPGVENAHLDYTGDRVTKVTYGVDPDFVGDVWEWDEVRHVVFDHYDAGDDPDHGEIGDVKFKTEEDSSNNAEETTYYRYVDRDSITAGYQPGLEMALAPAWYSRVAKDADGGGKTIGQMEAYLDGLTADSTVSTAQSTTFKDYLDYRFVYDHDNNDPDVRGDVAGAYSKAAGCGGGGAGRNIKEELTITKNPNAPSVIAWTVWFYKRELKYFDSSAVLIKQITTYENAFNQVMLRVVEEGPDLETASEPVVRSGDFYLHYVATSSFEATMVARHAENSAIMWDAIQAKIDEDEEDDFVTWQDVLEYVDTSGTYPDIPFSDIDMAYVPGEGGGAQRFYRTYISDDSGIVHHYFYGESTTANGTTPGDVEGKVKTVVATLGESGTQIAERRYTYIENDDGSPPADIVVYPVAQEWVRLDSSDYATYVEYDYTWHSGATYGDVIESHTTTRAIGEITVGNDPGSPLDDEDSLSSVSFYDKDGRVTWRLAESGEITYYAYDVLGQLTKRIDDVDTDGGGFSGKPDGWETDDGFGLHLITEYSYDDRGRLTETLGPEHKVDVAGDAALEIIRRATWRVYKEGDPISRDQRWSASGYKDVTNTSYGLVGPITVELLCKLNRALETMTVSSDPSDDVFTDNSPTGKLDKDDIVDVLDVDGDPENNDDKFTWSKVSFDYDGLLACRWTYHKIDTIADGGYGVEGTNYAETNYYYDEFGRRERVEASGKKTASYEDVVTVEIDGTAGEYRQTRSHPNVYTVGADNILAGPISISLRDEDGQLVCSMTATKSSVALDNGWAAGTEDLTDLTFLSLTYHMYDSQGRPDETRTYTDLTDVFDTGGATLDILPDAANGLYCATEVRAYDMASRVLRREDTSGVISAYVYDGVARVESEWLGTDDASSTRLNPGADPDMKEIRHTYYDEDRDGEGTCVPYVTRVRSLTPAGTAIASHHTDVDYAPYNIETVVSVDYRVYRSKVEGGAWAERFSDGVVSRWGKSYEIDAWNDDFDVVNDRGDLLTQSDSIYDGGERVITSETYKVSAGSPSDPLEMAYTYDDAGRLFTTEGEDEIVHEREYFANGRVKAELTKIDHDDDPETAAVCKDYREYLYEVLATGTGRVKEITQGTSASDDVIVMKLWYDTDWHGGSGVETFRLTGEQHIGATGSFGNTELTKYEYDTSGRQNVTILPDPDGAGTDLHPTKLETLYDDAGRVTEQKSTVVGAGTLLAQAKKVYSTTPLTGTRVANQLVTDELYEVPGGANHIDTDYYYDDYGRVCKVEYANESFRKTNYGLTGYALNRYLCTKEGANEDVDAVTDDIVVEQTDVDYDDLGRAIRTVTYRRREDDETDTTGGLSSSDSRLTHHVYYYDVQGRMTHSSDYGTDTTARPASPVDPGAADDILVTKFGYDDYGRRDSVINDKEQETKTFFDSASRVTYVAENYDDFAPPSTGVGGASGETDIDRVTKYEYDKLGQLEKQIALFPDSDDDQETWYVYSLQLADKGSTVKSNRLLRGIIYGDSDDKLDTADPYEKDFDPGTDTIYDRVEFTYNQDHTIASRKDQRTVTLEFEYDFRRRQTLSKFVATRPAGVDDTVQAIGRAFDELGRVVTVTSYDDTAGPSGTGNEVNEVKYAYNDWGLVATSWQAHDGEVDDEGEGESPHVHYTCDTSGDLRLTKVEYPDNRLVHYTYGTADYINDRLSRVYQICDDDGGNPDDPFATYTYIGAETIINIAYNIDGTGNDLELSYGVWNATPASAYTGLDTHDRIITQEWTFDSTVKDKYTYDYDDASNRLYRENTETTGKDELYNYDGLNRLTLFHRGDLDNDKDEIPVVDRQGGEEWDLTATGGWGGYRWDRDMDGSYTSPSGEDVNHTRDLNKANEIVDTDEPPDGEAIEETTGPEWVDPEYDLAGNMIYMPQPMLEFSSSYAVTVLYDAWHRLTVIYLDVNSNRQFDSGTDRPVQSCVYDGLNRMVDEKLYSLHGEPSVVADWSHYYNTAWQVLEVRSFEHEGAGNENPLEQYVWCLRYIDSPIIRFFDADTDGSATTYPDADYDDASDSVLYYLTDANFNVTGLVDKGDGDVVERYQYDPYGRVTWLNADWSNSMRPESMNRVLFAGYRWSPTGLYYARNRYYHPTLGKWLTRDPIGYGDGMNLYEYCGGSPTLTTDPSGLFVIVVGGAAGAGDAGMRTIAEKMVNEERDWYDANQPRTLLLGTGYSLISSPTGGGPTLIGQAVAFGIPNWPGAVGKLEQAIAAYETYRLAVDFVNWGERLLGLPPECRTQAEKLHIIGFSDGATTISLWLWKARRQEHAYGLIMAIDLVRRGNRLGTFPKELLNVPKGPGDEVPGQIGLGDAPNMLTHTSLYVPQKANAKVYRAIAHQTPAWDVRIAAGVIQASWTGHNLTGWDGNELIKGGLHTDFPSNEALVRDVMTGLEEALKKFEEDE